MMNFIMWCLLVLVYDVKRFGSWPSTRFKYTVYAEKKALV